MPCKIVVVLVTVAAVAALVYGVWFFTTPAAVRAFYWNRGLLERTVQFRAGKLPGVDPEQLNQSLADAGFTSVRDEGNCTVFYYSPFMAAISLWHEILYCPNGHSDIPNYHDGELIRVP
ncbi:MAG: hypothetical protein QM775_14300 [Pirellulales bacterium]